MPDSSSGQRRGTPLDATGAPRVIDPHLPMRRRLRDGTEVELRLIGPPDREALRRGFERLSPESRYLRFFTAMPRLPDEMVDRLVATDGWNHLAIGAERLHDPAPAAGDDPAVPDALPDGVGVARFVRLPDRPEVAEAAVAVVDELQGRGLGSLLLGALVTSARLRGITHFHGEVLPGNRAMRDLLERLDPHAIAAREEDVLVYDLELPAVDAPTPATEPLWTLLRLAAEGLRVVLEHFENLVPVPFRAAPSRDAADEEEGGGEPPGTS